MCQYKLHKAYTKKIQKSFKKLVLNQYDLSNIVVTHAF